MLIRLVILVYVLLFSCTTANANLLQNGDFSQGLDHWMHAATLPDFPSIIDMGDTHGNIADIAYGHGAIQQTFQVPTGKYLITLSSDYITRVSNMDALSYYGSLVALEIYVDGIYKVHNYLTSVNRWERGDVSITTNVNSSIGAYIYFQYGCIDQADWAGISVDNVSFTAVAVPEPCTMSVLLISSLCGCSLRGVRRLSKLND